MNFRAQKNKLLIVLSRAGPWCRQSGCSRHGIMGESRPCSQLETQSFKPEHLAGQSQERARKNKRGLWGQVWTHTHKHTYPHKARCRMALLRPWQTNVLPLLLLSNTGIFFQHLSFWTLMHGLDILCLEVFLETHLANCYSPFRYQSKRHFFRKPSPRTSTPIPVQALAF